jgi:LAS superfamily LD-carboxypeptidase LdcB
VDGIRALQARIVTLEQQLGVRPPVAAQPTMATAAAATEFQGLLESARTDLSAYANGQIPTSALTSIGGGEHLTGPAARAFEQLRVAAARDGVAFGVNDAYRPLADQHRLASELGLYSEGGLAAAPGTSTHGLGVSVDLDLDGRALTWMRANAGRYGFVNDVAGEPWHWTFEAGAA